MAKQEKIASPNMHVDSDDQEMHIGEMVVTREHDAVFGEISEDGPDYRNVCFISMDAIARY